MNTWFAARLIFETEIGGRPSSDPLCEESIRLIEAPELDAAEAKALVIGKESEHSYENEEHEVVQWRFKGVLEIYELCESQLTDGVEVYSRMYRKSNGHSGKD